MSRSNALAEHERSTSRHEQDLDSGLESSIRTSYNFKTFLKGDDIKVVASRGVVTLSGMVYQDHHRSLAQETASGLAGVKSVNNQLSVVADHPTEQSDGWISMKVKAILTFHKNVSATGTGVHTHKGVVTLSGNVASIEQKELTGEYVKEVEGVREVRNMLLVSKFTNTALEGLGEKVDDASITAQIKTSLLFHKSTHALATKVVTRDGVVTLSGEAKDETEKALATRLTEDIQDVRLVNNRMTVQKC